MPATRPIIIIKRPVQHAGHHGGAWKVAYADFVTAMMALFIVLWLLNSSDQVKEAVGGYFKDPNGVSKKVGTGQTGAGEAFAITKDNIVKIKEELQKSVRKMQNFEKLKNQIEMTVTAEGLRIELLEDERGTFFPSGASEPSADGQETLVALAKELGQLPNTVSIEGHTDSKTFSNGGVYTNWELSTDRANAARRTMQANGLGPKQVTQVRGYADQRLRKPTDPENPQNRRISLIVQYMPKIEDDDKASSKGTGQTAASSKAPAGSPAPKIH
jgi:chemotaxis protein MotB